MNGDGVAPFGEASRRLGAVVAGSLTRGLEVRLDEDCPLEEIAVGRYVTIHGRQRKFFGLVTDVELKSLHPGFTQTPPASDFIREVTAGVATFGSVRVTLYLTLDPLAMGGEGDAVRPAKTVPPHFSSALEASQEDVEVIFGREDASHFVIGTPLDMDVSVCLDYGRFIERSNGVFGKSGTGKTFLTRMLLANVMMKSNANRDPKRKAVSLIFDMHNEYGWVGSAEGGAGLVKSLKQLFPTSVSVFTLDPDSSRRRNANIDGEIGIGYREVEPDDLSILRETLNLTDRSVESAYQFRSHFRQEQWLAKTLELDSSDEVTKQLLAQLNVHEATFSNLQRGLRQLTRGRDFLRPDLPGEAVRDILQHLLRGKNVVIEFGRYGDDLAAYMLVANLFSRRIHEEYRRRSEEALGDQAQAPPHLMIAIEEAHKFLSPQIADQTIFGQIAREMRKYNVTLLVIDQRPSAIDAEVMSQLGTKIACLLDNDADVSAVLSGVSGSSELRSVLARLESRQQALILGHSVPMPVVVRTPDYGTAESYAQFHDGPGLRERLTLQELYDD